MGRSSRLCDGLRHPALLTHIARTGRVQCPQIIPRVHAGMHKHTRIETETTTEDSNNIKLKTHTLARTHARTHAHARAGLTHVRNTISVFFLCTAGAKTTAATGQTVTAPGIVPNGKTARRLWDLASNQPVVTDRFGVGSRSVCVYYIYTVTRNASWSCDEIKTYNG